METNTTTAVALLPDRATKSVKPKPRRAEVIAALVELKRKALTTLLADLNGETEPKAITV